MSRKLEKHFLLMFFFPYLFNTWIKKIVKTFTGISTKRIILFHLSLISCSFKDSSIQDLNLHSFAKRGMLGLFFYLREKMWFYSFGCTSDGLKESQGWILQWNLKVKVIITVITCRKKRLCSLYYGKCIYVSPTLSSSSEIWTIRTLSKTLVSKCLNFSVLSGNSVQREASIFIKEIFKLYVNWSYVPVSWNTIIFVY